MLMKKMLLKSQLLVLLVIFIIGFSNSHHRSKLRINNRLKFHFNKYNNIDITNSLNGETNTSFHLPDNIVPVEYHIKILPYFEEKNFTFVSEIKILLYIHKATNKIILNSLNLNFNESSTAVSTTTVNSDGLTEKIDITEVKFDYNAEQAIITTETFLKTANEYNLVINYTGYISENMWGFYRSWYTTKNDELRWIMVTNMGAKHARTVFPCFDEPHFRTPFTIHIARFKNKTSLASVPTYMTSLPDSSIDDRVWDEYQTTAAIPTYLVSFYISDLQPIRTQSVNMWVRPGLAHQTRYVLSRVNDVINILNNLTGIAFNLLRMDFIAVPDMNRDGVESWGLALFRERNLLFEPQISTAIDKQLILCTVAHEFAYLWFGNLVSPELWKYMWLNKAIATYFMYYIPSQMEPTWRMMDQFVIYELQTALSQDIGNNCLLNNNISTAEETESVFDSYTYKRGCSILRMIENFVGRPIFIKGFKKYLKYGVQQLGGAVSPSVLWEDFENVVPTNLLPEGKKFQDIIESWTKQKGYPLVTVIRNYENSTAIIMQEAFSEELNVNKTKQQWWIPLTTDKLNDFRTNSENVMWLKPNETKEIFVESDTWILFNIQQAGYYRVNYDENNWSLLADQLMRNHSVIQPINRAQIIDDAFALAEIGKIKYHIPLKLAKYLRNEIDFIPWYTAVKSFTKLFNKLYNTTAESILKEYVHYLLKPVYNYILNIEEEGITHTVKLLFNTIFQFACEVNFSECKKDIGKEFEEWVAKPTAYELIPETRISVFCTGVKYGTEQSWNDLWNYYKKSDVSSEKFEILQGLGCSTDPGIIKKYLSMLTNMKPPLDIRQQDYKYVFHSILTHQHNTEVAIEFVIENYKLFQNNAAKQILASFFKSLSEIIVKEKDFSKLQEFYNNAGKQLGNLNLILKNALINIKSRIEWKQKYFKVIEKYLDLFKNETILSDGFEVLRILPSTDVTITDSSISSTILNKSLAYLLVVLIFYLKNNIFILQ